MGLPTAKPPTVTLTEFRIHLHMLDRYYPVPPMNTTRVVVSTSHVGGEPNQFYVSIEDLERSTSLWKHRPGSASLYGGMRTFETAEEAASELWRRLRDNLRWDITWKDLPNDER